MSNVAFHSSLLALLQKIYKPIYVWAKANLATKTELSQNGDEHLHPVDISSLTPSSTFTKNSVIGINGVLYRAKKNTSNFPLPMQTQNGAFVTHVVNGNIAFVTTGTTINSDWEVWTDASIPYALVSKLQLNSTLTVNGTSYTIQQLLEAVVQLMDKKVVVSLS